MAFVAQDDKQNLNNGQQQPGSGVVGAGTGTFAGSAGGANTSTQPVSTAGIGAGGGGGWTNIQSYLTANQGSTGSSDALKNTAGSAFNQDQKNLDQSSSQAKDQANQQVQKTNIGQDQASQMISEMGKNYSYSGPQNQTYNQDLSRFQTGVNSTYQGPTSYNYGMSGDSQRYGQSLQSDQGFQGLMSDLYNRSAGGVMNQGQLSLQQNLDTNNDALNSARQSLVNQYAGLQGNIQNTVASTDQAVRDAQSQFAKNQQGIRSYLLGTQGTNQQSLQNAVNDWNSAEQAIASGQNRVLFGTSPQGPETRNFNLNVLDRYGLPQTLTTSRALNDSDYYNYASGGVADQTNVGGVDAQRARLNALSDILGGKKIAQSTPLTHGGYNFDRGRYDQAWGDAEKSAMDELNQKWHFQSAAPSAPSSNPNPFGNKTPNIFGGSGPFNSGF